MTEGKRFLVDVGIRDFPFPIRCASRENPDGQKTIADISVSTRIMQYFEAGWIDRFIRILHSHREDISTSSLRKNIWDYYDELQAKNVEITLEYPFFVVKETPVSKQKCLVSYRCKYTCRAPSINGQPKILFRIDAPIITTHPQSHRNKPQALFGQLSIITVETESEKEIYPEDLVDMIDKNALTPVYSFLAEEDQDYLVDKIHTEQKHSVVVVDQIKEELGQQPDLEWFYVKCVNHSMLHPYKTFIDTEKSLWVPFRGFEDDL